MTPEALARLHAECFRLPPPWSAQAFAGMLADQACLVRTRMAGDTLVAFALFRVVLDEAELLTLATAPAARRAGHARALLHEGFAEVATRGAGACFLEVASDNRAALRLYDAMGFEEQGRRKGYYRAADHPPVDALILRAMLG